MEEDPLLMKEFCDKYGVKVSGLSAHSPLMKPEAAVSRLTRAMVLASFVGCDFLNSDEMIKPDWMDDELAHTTMKYTLSKMALMAARHRKVLLAEEGHPSNRFQERGMVVRKIKCHIPASLLTPSSLCSLRPSLAREGRSHRKVAWGE